MRLLVIFFYLLVIMTSNAITSTRTSTSTSTYTRVIVFHKPVGLITTNNDELGRETVIEALRKNGLPFELHDCLVSCGRLDKDTSGLLLLTNDGLLAHHITNPTAVVTQGQKSSHHHLTKEYRAKCMNWPTEETLQRLRQGVDLGGGLGCSQPATIEIESTVEKPKSTWLRITIAEGKNRQIRRMLHAVGHGCMELERVRIGGIILGKIAPNPGDFCEISGEEILGALGFQPRVIFGGVAGKDHERAQWSSRRDRSRRRRR